LFCLSTCEGFVPAPMLFGALIDSSCRLWQTSTPSSCSDGAGSGGRSRGARGGSCLLFDTDAFRWRTYGVALAVQVLQLVFAVLLYVSIRRRRFDNLELHSRQITSAKDDNAETPSYSEPDGVNKLSLVEMNQRDDAAVVRV